MLAEQLNLLTWAATAPAELRPLLSSVKPGDIITVDPWKGPKCPKSGEPLFAEGDQLQVEGLRNNSVGVSYDNGNAFASVWLRAIATINGQPVIDDLAPDATPEPETEPEPAPKVKPQEMGEVAIFERQAFYSAVANGCWLPYAGTPPRKGHQVKAKESPWAFEFLKLDGEDAIAQFVGYPQFLRRISLNQLLVAAGGAE
ncbi:MAG TPA: hypothetical protein V6D06_18315 [Trichocoleus sp.]